MSLPAEAGIVLAIAAAAAIIDWAGVWYERRLVEYVAKPATLAALIGVAVILAATPGATVSRTQAALFIGGLVFSLAGDVLLMVLRDNIIPGLVSFLVGHVLYIVGFNVISLEAPGAAAGAVVVAAAVLLLLCWFVFDWFRGVEERPALLTYMVVIGVMLASAWTLPWRVGVPPASAVAGMVGATLFVFSDSMIARSRFVADFAHSHFWITITYHVGQAGLVLSLVA